LERFIGILCNFIAECKLVSEENGQNAAIDRMTVANSADAKEPVIMLEIEEYDCLLERFRFNAMIFCNALGNKNASIFCIGQFLM
jgi:hypothetical protein